MGTFLDRLLPVIRQTRTPLLVGYVLLLVGWVVADHWVDLDTPTGFVAVIDDALAVLGDFGRGLAVSIAAFLVGSMITYYLDGKIFKDPEDGGTRRNRGFVGSMITSYLDGKIFEFPRVGGTQRSLGETDLRNLNEGRLRIYLAMALAVLVAVTAWRFQWQWVFAAAVPSLLGRHGLALYREAQRAEAKEFEPDESQFSTRYATATGQLAHEDRVVRLAGVYELGKLAQHSQDYRETIYDILAATIRNRAPHIDDPDAEPLTWQQREEVQASIKSLGIAEHGPRAGGQRVDLTGRDLTGYVFGGGHYENVDFTRSNLSNALLVGTNLTSANLHRANLQRANLTGANLDGAILNRANLQEADLWEANLDGAQLQLANLTETELTMAALRGADLHGADLHGANLIGADLRGADLTSTKLPDGFDRSTAKFNDTNGPT